MSAFLPVFMRICAACTTVMRGKEWAAVLSSLHGHHRVPGYLPSSSGEN